MKSPVAFLIFRRPDQTRRVFAEIARARPPHLLVVADGPRNEAERAACEKTRAVIRAIDWPCRVETDFASENMGCRRRVSSGLNWVFSRVDEAIILEDDCLPAPSFFAFCDELLGRYRHDPRVGHIGGTDHNRGGPRGSGSYYASRYTSIWGWATWRRCWSRYDVNLGAWPQMKAAGGHMGLFSTPEEARHFAYVWDEIRAGTLDTWDAQWLFCCLTQGFASLVPNGNLITNIGFHAEATHTRVMNHPFAELPLRDVTLPLRHPAALVPDDVVDRRRAGEEFLNRPSAWLQVARWLGNKHAYGKVLRTIPGVGPAWAAWRARCRTGRGGG